MEGLFKALQKQTCSAPDFSRLLKKQIEIIRRDHFTNNSASTLKSSQLRKTASKNEDIKSKTRGDASIEGNTNLAPTEEEARSTVVNARHPKTGTGLLHQAILTGDDSYVEVLINEYGNVLDLASSDDDSGWPPLIYAIAMGASKETVRLLSQFPEGLFAVDPKTGDTALHWAAKMNRVDLLDCLMENASPCNNQKPLLNINVQTNPARDTPLHLACLNCAEDSAIRLIEAGADLNIPNRLKDYSVHIAVRKRLPNVVGAILKSGRLKTTFCVDAEGNTPLHLARREKLDALSRLLESYGFDPQQENYLGLTPNTITQQIAGEEKDAVRRRAAAQQNREERKKREREEHMEKTEVTQFLREFQLDELAEKFHQKKIYFVDTYFLSLDNTRLKKLGFSVEERDRFLKALEERARRLLEEEALEQETARQSQHHQKLRVWIIFLLIVGLFFLGMFLLWPLLVVHQKRSVRPRGL